MKSDVSLLKHMVQDILSGEKNRIDCIDQKKYLTEDKKKFTEKGRYYFYFYNQKKKNHKKLKVN